MRVLIYTGYYKQPWSPHRMEGVGGTEVAVVNLSRQLVHFGCQVVVSGVVEPGNWWGVEWLPTEELHQRYRDQFDLIIGASYLHFVLEFEGYRAKKLFWVHNVDYHPWYRGDRIVDSDLLLSPAHLDGIICLTHWHRAQWSQKYGIDPDRIHVIGNGIQPESFIGVDRPKVRDRFIWSSAPERGLSELIDNWPKIRVLKPNATLHIYSPGYQRAEQSLTSLELGIQVMGTVDQATLHAAMLQAEYWPYLTRYEETYCITALEMQFARVLPITTQVAALAEVVQGGIILPLDETKWDLALQLLGSLERGLQERVVEANQCWAKRATWSARTLEWYNLLKEYAN